MSSATAVHESSSAFTVHEARPVKPARQRKPVYFRPKRTARGARPVTRINRAVPQTRPIGRKSVKEEEPSGAQRWLSMVDENEDEDVEELILEIVPETNDFIAVVEDALNFISVMGPTRSGKSTLMNLLAECKEKELFPTAGGGISYTKGIDLGNKIMTVEEFSKADGGQEVSPIVPGQQVAFLDTEGQGDQGDNYDISLFTPAILCSRIVIFNTKEVAKDYLLGQLALMTTIAQRIKLDDEEEDPENPGPKFGELAIVINQYTLGDSVEIVKQNILGQESGASEAVKRRNRIRTMLYALFEDVNLYILRGNQLKPGVEEELESGVKKFLLLSDFLPVYVAEFLNLRTAFAEKLRYPRLVAQESMSGQSVAGLVPAIVDAINSEDPLDIPDLWEQTQTAAILKASLVFREAFRASCDAVLQSPDLLSTAQVAALLGPEIDRLLYEMERSLSYIPIAKIAATRALLSEEAAVGKQNTLDHNLVRIKSEAQIKLTELISALPEHLISEFPNLLVSRATAMTRIEQLKARLFEAYKAWVIGYDPLGYPEGYHGKFDTAYQNELTIMLETIQLGWIQWVVTTDEETLQPVKIALDILTTETPLGDLVKWKRGAEDLRADTLLKYNGVVDASYLWTDPAAVKEGFVAKLTEIIAVSEENFKQDEEAIKLLIEAALATQVQYFQNHLLTALVPRKEPGDYNTLIDRTAYRTVLQVLMATSNISEGLTQYYLLQWETRTVVMINKFSDDYSRAAVAFITYLDGELAIIVPHKVGDFQLAADKIRIHKDLAKTELRSLLDSQGNNVLATFDNDIMVFAITQNAGQVRIDSSRRDLVEKIEGHRGTKLILLQDAVNDWNREKLNLDTQPVLMGVVDFTIDTTPKLQTAITRAKTEFWSHTSGDEADRVYGWSSFENQVPGLLENVRRASALFIGKVNGTDGATSQMELMVLQKIYGSVANTANMLGMSWINSVSEFNVQTTSGGGKDGRYHVYRNVPVPGAGYDWEHPTSLKFHKWRVEFSDFRFDEPIIQELVPFQINSYTPPLSDTETIVKVTYNQSQSEVITNSSATMLKFDFEYTSSAGLAGVASTTVKTAFGGSGTFTDTTANTIGFSINVETPITCPPNRITVIHHLGFKQKTSMTYTAKVKIVPSVLFTGGFTAYGGGPYTNPNLDRPNYHKQHTGNRFYGDIENGYSDEFKVKAASDSDPWAWRACIGRHSQVQNYVNSLALEAPYEIYVRGKWEGINGWKHVITKSISVPT